MFVLIVSNIFHLFSLIKCITSFSTSLQIRCIITSWFGTKHPLICFLFSCSFIIWNLILCLNYWFLNCKFAMFKLVKVKSFCLDVNCISLPNNIFLSGQYNRYFLSIESNRMMCIQHELLFYWDKRIIKMTNRYCQFLFTSTKNIQPRGLHLFYLFYFCLKDPKNWMLLLWNTYHRLNMNHSKTDALY